jgi:hypothetical protein
MAKPTSYTLPAYLVKAAVKFLHEHQTLLLRQRLSASAEIVEGLISQIENTVVLQTPQTVEQQVAVLTEVMGCGPDDELKGNRD